MICTKSTNCISTAVQELARGVIIWSPCPVHTFAKAPGLGVLEKSFHRLSRSVQDSTGQLTIGMDFVFFID